jgi:regulator of ribonuclease activity B
MRPGPDQVRAVERIDDPREADARVLEHLASLGCDLAEPREVRHFFFAVDRVDAQRVADVLAHEGWWARVDAQDDAWVVVAGNRQSLSPWLVGRTRARFEALAAQHRAHYDGWEADRSSPP